MKVYRVVSNILTGDIRNGAELNVEHAYYKMGYAAFTESNMHGSNTLNSDGKVGKYFYLFPEDALKNSGEVIFTHRQKCTTCSVVEYDIPMDIVFQNIGYGTYDWYPSPLRYVETFIEKRDFKSNIITSDQIERERKLEGLIDIFNETLKLFKEYGDYSEADIQYYNYFFRHADVISLIDDRAQLKEVLLACDIFARFITRRRKLVQSPYITGKSVSVNFKYLAKVLSDDAKKSEYYRNLGFDCDFSREQEDFKREFINALKYHDAEEAKRMLMERKQ